MAAGKVVQKGPGLASIKAAMAEMQKHELKIGLVGPRAEATHGKAPMSVAALGAIHEYGLGVPARPFIGPTFDDNKPAFARLLTDAARRIVNGADVVGALSGVGIVGRAMVVKRIDDGNFTPLAQYTIDKKGHADPLVETYEMRAAVDFEVRRKGSGGGGQ